MARDEKCGNDIHNEVALRNYDGNAFNVLIITSAVAWTLSQTGILTESGSSILLKLCGLPDGDPEIKDTFLSSIIRF